MSGFGTLLHRPSQGLSEFPRFATGVRASVSKRLKVGHPKAVCHLQLDEHELTVGIDCQDIEAILILLEIGQLLSENQQRLANKLRTIDDPGL
jgi:hypothetical protein